MTFITHPGVSAWVATLNQNEKKATNSGPQNPNAARMALPTVHSICQTCATSLNSAQKYTPGVFTMITWLKLHWQPHWNEARAVALASRALPVARGQCHWLCILGLTMKESYLNSSCRQFIYNKLPLGELQEMFRRVLSVNGFSSKINKWAGARFNLSSLRLKFWAENQNWRLSNANLVWARPSDSGNGGSECEDALRWCSGVYGSFASAVTVCGTVTRACKAGDKFIYQSICMQWNRIGTFWWVIAPSFFRWASAGLRWDCWNRDASLNVTSEIQ
jgi:hypothetical protein